MKQKLSTTFRQFWSDTLGYFFPMPIIQYYDCILFRHIKELSDAAFENDNKKKIEKH